MSASRCLPRLVVTFTDRITCNFIFNVVSDDGQFQIPLAKQDGASWDVGTGATNPILKYLYNDPGSGQKNIEIELICNADPG